MALTLKQTVVLQKWLEGRVAELKENVDKYFKATGKTRDSIGWEIKGDSALITGSSILYFGENGRGKTEKGTAPGKLKDIIREWIDVKGIQPKDNISKDTLAYLITRKIHRDGIKVGATNPYNPGNILSSVIDAESVNELIEEFSDVLVGEFESELLTALNIE